MDLWQSAKNNDVIAIHETLSDSNAPLSLLEASDDYGRTPLVVAAANGATNAVKFLLEQGANIDSQEQESGWTAAHYASYNLNLRSIMALSDSSVDIRDNDRQSYIDLVMMQQSHLYVTDDQPILGRYVKKESCIECGGSGTPLLSSGSMFSFGHGTDFVLGTLQDTDAPKPRRSFHIGGFIVEVAASKHSSAAIIKHKSGTSLLTWGLAGPTGRLGHGEAAPPITIPPTVVSRLVNPVHVFLGTNISAVIDVEGSLWTWGDNSSSMLGIHPMPKSPRKTPRKLSHFDEVVDLAIGHGHVAAVTMDGHVFSWGSGASGELGYSKAEPQVIPRRVGVSHHVTSVAAGRSFTAMLSDDGAVFVCGFGQHSPRSVNIEWVTDGINYCMRAPRTIVSMSACCEGDVCLLVTASGQLHAFGQDCDFIGRADKPVLQASLVQGLDALHDAGGRVVSVSMGESHLVLIDQFGRSWSMGDPEYTGTGTSTLSHIAEPRRVSSVACGSRHTLIVSGHSVPISGRRAATVTDSSMADLFERMCENDVDIVAPDVSICNTSGECMAMCHASLIEARSPVWKQQLRNGVITVPDEWHGDIVHGVVRYLYTDELNGSQVVQDCIEALDIKHVLTHDIASMSTHTDITVKCGNADFPCHRWYLASRAPFFAALFTSNMRDGIAGGTLEFPFLDKAQFKLLRDYMYAGKLGDISLGDSLELLRVADFLMYAELQRHLEHILMGHVEPFNVGSFLCVSALHNAHRLLRYCRRFVCQNLDSVLSSKTLFCVDSHELRVLEHLLKKHVPKCRSEIDHQLDSWTDDEDDVSEEEEPEVHLPVVHRRAKPVRRKAASPTPPHQPSSPPMTPSKTQWDMQQPSPHRSLLSIMEEEESVKKPVYRHPLPASESMHIRIADLIAQQQRRTRKQSHSSEKKGWEVIQSPPPESLLEIQTEQMAKPRPRVTSSKWVPRDYQVDVSLSAIQSEQETERELCDLVIGEVVYGIVVEVAVETEEEAIIEAVTMVEKKKGRRRRRKLH